MDAYLNIEKTEDGSASAAFDWHNGTEFFSPWNGGPYSLNASDKDGN